jgi:hypothetical protein
MNAPFVGVLLSGSIFAMTAMIVSAVDIVRKAALVCSSLLLGLSVVEASMYFATRSQTIITETVPREWRQDAMSIGPLPLPTSAAQFKELLKYIKR